jgi:2'-5' RNA ligase
MDMSMGCEGNGVPRIPAEQRLNVYALVIYIPDPLGKFLDDLRRQLVPGCNPHAHVSVLPPRPLSGDWQEAREQVKGLAGSWKPFDITLKDIAVFPVTNVIYIELAQGSEEMYRLHAAMNAKALQFDEPFEYHPHVTLAQEISGDSVTAMHARARSLWAEYQGPRTFRADRAAFVQNTLGNLWVDLAEYTLGATGDLVALRR